MVQLPPFLVRIVAGFVTQALTRKLANSPVFFRIVDRMIHEMDHMPHRIQGHQVPKYQPPLGHCENVWEEDQGEPHDIPSPFPSSKPNSTSKPSATSFGEAQRQRARQSFAQSQRIAERDRASEQESKKKSQTDKTTKELREVLEKLRELQRK